MTIQQELDFPTFLTYGKETSRFGMWFQKVWVGDGNFLLLVSSLSDKTLALSRKTFSCPEEGFSQEKDHFGSFSIEQTHPGSFFQNDYPILGDKVSSDAFTISIDLKDAFLQIPVQKVFRPYLGFM